MSELSAESAESSGGFSSKDVASDLEAAAHERRTLRDKLAMARGISADAYIAPHQPRTLEKPERGAGWAMQVMHMMHATGHRFGRLANANYERKTPDWPVPETLPENVSVLGFGAERIAFGIHAEDGRDMVMGVFHADNFLRDPHDTILKKKAHYDTYRRYFGDLVVPTAFLEVDNPWGEGKVAATLQYNWGEAENIGDVPAEELQRRAAEDPQLAEGLRALQTGYLSMLEDGQVPDLASSNVLLRGSEVLLPDTGKISPIKRLDHLRKIHATFDMIRDLELPEAS